MTPRHGLYAVTSEALCAAPAALIAGVSAALRGGAVMIQYRDKWNGPAARERLARALLDCCRAHAVPLIINDDVALAALIGADGVHLGRSDTALEVARQQLGPGALIGISCGTDVEYAGVAAAQRADYVAFGRFYPSRTKPQAAAASLQILELAKAVLPPQTLRCAIGGITPLNATPLLQRGAQLLAAVEGVFGAADIESAARDYSRLFK